MWKKPFPEVDHLRKRLIFCIGNKTALTRQQSGKGGSSFLEMEHDYQ